MRVIQAGAARAISLACVVALGSFNVTMTGCENDPAIAPVEPAKPVPTYEHVREAYNRRADKLARLRATAVIRLTYKDEKGQPRTDQGEGLLQLIRPDRVALSINKAGKRLFWFGCDRERYWFFDVVDEKIAKVGKHPKIGEGDQGVEGGIAIPPLELFHLMGLTPLEASTENKIAWSADGKQLEVTTPATGNAPGTSRKLSLDPMSFEPSRIEIRDAAGRAVIAATLSAYEGVQIAGQGGLKPRVATHIDAEHKETDTRIQLDISEMRDSGIADIAFVFEELKKALGAEKVIDLDAPHPAPRPSPQPAPPQGNK